MTKPKYLPFLLLIILFFISCNNKSTIVPPENLISKETVEDVLVEMYLIEAEMRVRIVNEPLSDLNIWINIEMNNLFKKHNITYQQYADSYTYHMTDKKNSKKTMENAVNRLVKLQAEQVKTIKQVK